MDHRKHLLSTIALLTFSLTGFSQSQHIATVDIVNAKTAYEKEAIFFYEHNWKAFREEALKLGYVSGYELIKAPADTTGWFKIILITHFGDSAQYKKVEENFRPIMSRLSPNGPKMLNDVKRSEFLKPLGSHRGQVLFVK